MGPNLILQPDLLEWLSIELSREGYLSDIRFLHLIHGRPNRTLLGIVLFLCELVSPHTGAMKS